MGQVMKFFEIICLEVIGLKKTLVKYFLCGIFSILSDSQTYCDYLGCSSEQNLNRASLNSKPYSKSGSLLSMEEGRH